MIPDVSEALSWLENHYYALKGINRGIERETLRITPEGRLAKMPFPTAIGAALTHKWITTDFAEAMLEFVTPVNQDIDTTLAFLTDLHIYSINNIGDELLWPLSMPCFVAKKDDVLLAQYGNSNAGKVKTIYRQGLKARYGAMMQTISGVHYNFSLPLEFWQLKYGISDEVSGKKEIAEGYFRLIRNYFRFGWVIPYLFGASPSLCSSFIQDEDKKRNFENLTQGNGYLPYATSLRMSDLGYTNDTQSKLNITFNHLDSYVKGIQHATQMKSNKFAELGVYDNGQWNQLNDHVLQIDNEFYAPIRPKCVPQTNETPSQALLNRSVQYIEVRALDINPFSPIGVDADQIRFLDVFLIWCILAQAPDMSVQELQCNKKNWERIILEGRKPGQTIGIGCDTDQQLVSHVGPQLFSDLLRVAAILDKNEKTDDYQNVISKLQHCFVDPQLTFSGKMLTSIQEIGTNALGLTLAKQYKQQLLTQPLQILTQNDFINEHHRSLAAQQQLEAEDNMSFSQYLKTYINTSC